MGWCGDVVMRRADGDGIMMDGDVVVLVMGMAILTIIMSDVVFWPWPLRGVWISSAPCRQGNQSALHRSSIDSLSCFALGLDACSSIEVGLAFSWSPRAVFPTDDEKRAVRSGLMWRVWWSWCDGDGQTVMWCHVLWCMMSVLSDVYNDGGDGHGHDDSKLMQIWWRNDFEMKDNLQPTLSTTPNPRWWVPSEHIFHVVPSVPCCLQKPSKSSQILDHISNISVLDVIATQSKLMWRNIDRWRTVHHGQIDDIGEGCLATFSRAK